MNDLVTVVTVTFNAEDFLEETILSVIDQNYKNIEYIIIDGASTDGTIDIIKKYKEHISYWISEPDEGIYYAMNKGTEKATGEWINFMNAGDTFFDSETIQYVMDHKDERAELIYGNFQIKESGVVKKAWDKSQWRLQMPFCHQTLFTRTALMKKEQFNTNFRLAADHNFIVKMSEDHKKFNYIDRTIAIFTLGGFAESNRFLMRIESLKILLDHKVPQEEIEESAWYRGISQSICQVDKNHISTLEKVIQAQEERTKYLSAILDAVRQLTNYSIWTQPLKKYKNYKAMLITYNKISNLQKGNKINEKQ